VSNIELAVGVAWMVGWTAIGPRYLEMPGFSAAMMAWWTYTLAMVMCVLAGAKFGL
jgi:hypothetical protein